MCRFGFAVGLLSGSLVFWGSLLHVLCVVLCFVLGFCGVACRQWLELGGVFVFCFLRLGFFDDFCFN